MSRAAAIGFSTLAEFLEYTAADDRQFLLEEDLTRFSTVACGMVNGVGGWIVLGATYDDDEERPLPQGVTDPARLKERLSDDMARSLSASPTASFHFLDDPVPLLIVQLKPADWSSRPVCVGRDYRRGVYRRVEGVDLVSGSMTRFRFGMDALERLRSDRPMTGMTLTDLHEESVKAFRDAVALRRPEWVSLAMPAFLSRSHVLSNNAVTQAGYYLLGKNSVRVRAELVEADGSTETLEVRNLWKAWWDLLPRLCQMLSPACAAAFRECFVNALLHSEYEAGEGPITLTETQDSVRIENPGLMRTWKPGESVCRNFRLMKIFQLLGAASGDGRGLAAIRDYQPDFRVEQDILELSTVVVLHLERILALGAPPESLTPERPSVEPGSSLAREFIISSLQSSVIFPAAEPAVSTPPPVEPQIPSDVTERRPHPLPSALDPEASPSEGVPPKAALPTTAHPEATKPDAAQTGPVQSSSIPTIQATQDRAVQAGAASPLAREAVIPSLQQSAATSPSAESAAARSQPAVSAPNGLEPTKRAPTAPTLPDAKPQAKSAAASVASAPTAAQVERPASAAPTPSAPTLRSKAAPTPPTTPAAPVPPAPSPSMPEPAKKPAQAPQVPVVPSGVPVVQARPKVSTPPKPAVLVARDAPAPSPAPTQPAMLLVAGSKASQSAPAKPGQAQTMRPIILATALGAPAKGPQAQASRTAKPQAPKPKAPEPGILPQRELPLTQGRAPVSENEPAVPLVRLRSPESPSPGAEPASASPAQPAQAAGEPENAPKRRSSFGNAAEDLERAIEEMRSRGGAKK